MNRRPALVSRSIRGRARRAATRSDQVARSQCEPRLHCGPHRCRPGPHRLGSGCCRVVGRPRVRRSRLRYTVAGTGADGASCDATGPTARMNRRRAARPGSPPPLWLFGEPAPQGRVGCVARRHSPGREPDVHQRHVVIARASRLLGHDFLERGVGELIAESSNEITPSVQATRRATSATCQARLCTSPRGPSRRTTAPSSVPRGPSADRRAGPPGGGRRRATPPCGRVPPAGEVDVPQANIASLP